MTGYGRIDAETRHKLQAFDGVRLYELSKDDFSELRNALWDLLGVKISAPEHVDADPFLSEWRISGDNGSSGLHGVYLCLDVWNMAGDLA